MSVLSEACPEIFNRNLIRLRRQRADKIERKEKDFLFRLSARHMLERLDLIRREGFSNAVLCDTRIPPDVVSLFWERLSVGSGYVLSFHEDNRFQSVRGDEELWPFHGIDFIGACLMLQDVNDLPGTLVQMQRSLAPDGLFMTCMLGGQTLQELRMALQAAEIEIRGGFHPRVHPFADRQTIGSLMQRAGFAMPVIDSETIRVSYACLADLVQDLRAMGWTNALVQQEKACAPRNLFKVAENIYRSKFSDVHDRLDVSFEFIHAIGWAPHNSQQKPMRPGSATHRLADALQTQEVGTGVKTGRAEEK